MDHLDAFLLGGMSEFLADTLDRLQL